MVDHDRNLEDCQELVGSGPSQPTNQPVFYCSITGLFYLDRECTHAVKVGKHDEMTLQLDDSWHPSSLRTKLLLAESDLRKLTFQLESATLTGEVYQDLANERVPQVVVAGLRNDIAALQGDVAALTHERDRARETAMALEEELEAAKRNLWHVRTTMDAVMGFLRDCTVGPSSFTEYLRHELIDAVCEVCTPVTADTVLPLDHPLLEGAEVVNAIIEEEPF